MGETQYRIVEQLTEQDLINNIQDILDIAKESGHSGYSERDVHSMEMDIREGNKKGKGSYAVSEREFKVVDDTVYSSAGQTDTTFTRFGEVTRSSTETWISIGATEDANGHSMKVIISPESGELKYTYRSNVDQQYKHDSSYLPGMEGYDMKLIGLHQDLKRLMKGLINGEDIQE